MPFPVIPIIVAGLATTSLASTSLLLHSRIELSRSEKKKEESGKERMPDTEHINEKNALEAEYCAAMATMQENYEKTVDSMQRKHAQTIASVNTNQKNSEVKITSLEQENTETKKALTYLNTQYNDVLSQTALHKQTTECMMADFREALAQLQRASLEKPHPTHMYICESSSCPPAFFDLDHMQLPSTINNEDSFSMSRSFSSDSSIFDMSMSQVSETAEISNDNSRPLTPIKGIVFHEGSFIDTGSSMSVNNVAQSYI